MNEKKYVGSGKKMGNYDLVNFTIAEEKTKDAWKLGNFEMGKPISKWDFPFSNWGFSIYPNQFI